MADPPADPAVRSARELLHRLADHPEASASPVDRLTDLDRRDRSQNIDLKLRYARRLLWLLSFQLAVSNVVFVFYAWIGWDWQVPDGVMLGWLGATVVELVGVVLVVVHHLFPQGDPT